jgi:uncharacterized NAD(P)/FAD-binding protein YdhS
MSQPARVLDSGRRATIAIVGAGFSGTALAIRLLRTASDRPLRVVVIERSGRFGPGLAYGDGARSAVLNVPAGRMSVHEDLPDDFLEYLRRRGLPVQRQDFVPRVLYGEYLEHRLTAACRQAPAPVQVVRVTGDVRRVERTRSRGAWSLQLGDARTLHADATVLALGHEPPRNFTGMGSLTAHSGYVPDPWQRGSTAGRRVLLIGTGLTMADVAVDLARQPRPPEHMLAISRRGLLARTRFEHEPRPSRSDLGLSDLDDAWTLREMLRATRSLLQRAQRAGMDWRDVMPELRSRAPTLWNRFDRTERRRLMRHLLPFWDVHRHQLPPPVGRTVHSLIAQGRLEVRAARVVDATPAPDGALHIGIRPRGSDHVETHVFDQVINCSGPDTDPRRSRAPLVQGLVEAGWLTADPTGAGLRTDRDGRLVDRTLHAVPGLYYLGPWLKARDFEATAAAELRTHATALATLLHDEVEARRLHAAVA